MKLQTLEQAVTVEWTGDDAYNKVYQAVQSANSKFVNDGVTSGLLDSSYPHASLFVSSELDQTDSYGTQYYSVRLNKTDRTHALYVNGYTRDWIYTLQQELATIARDNFGKPNAPKITREFARLMRESKIKLMPSWVTAITNAIGEINATMSKPQEFTLSIEPFDRDNGASYYFHSSSCWFDEDGSYYHSGENFQHNGGYAVMLRQGNKPYARLWAIETSGYVGLFNHYGASNYGTIAQLVAKMLDAEIFRAYACGVDNDELWYTNDSSWYWLADKGTDTSRITTVYNTWESVAESGECCDCCGNSVPRDEINYVENSDEHVCDRCLSRHYSLCAGCDMYSHDDYVTYVSGHGSYCESCLENFSRCENCGELCESTDNDGNCSDCAYTLIIEGVSEFYHNSPAYNAIDGLRFYASGSRLFFRDNRSGDTLYNVPFTRIDTDEIKRAIGKTIVTLKRAIASGIVITRGSYYTDEGMALHNTLNNAVWR